MSNVRLISLFFIVVVLLSSCKKAQDIVYVGDLQHSEAITLPHPKPIRMLPGDKFNIIIHSRDKDLVEMFNLITPSGSGNTAQLCAYTVGDDGSIEMPIVGNMVVEGLTRSEVQNLVRQELISSELVRDPIVTLEYVDINYFVLGETGAGKHPFTRDCLTLLEAMAECGDLALSGRRDNVTVLRTEGGVKRAYKVDLTKGSDVFRSPVYYLQQNDIIYVEPDRMQIESRSPIGSGLRTPAFWIGIFNFALSVLLLLK